MWLGLIIIRVLRRSFTLWPYWWIFHCIIMMLIIIIGSLVWISQVHVFCSFIEDSVSSIFIMYRFRPRIHACFINSFITNISRAKNWIFSWQCSLIFISVLLRPCECHRLSIERSIWHQQFFGLSSVWNFRKNLLF